MTEKVHVNMKKVINAITNVNDQYVIFNAMPV